MSYTAQELAAREKQINAIMLAACQKHGLPNADKILSLVYQVQATMDKLAFKVEPAQQELFKKVCREIDALYNAAHDAVDASQAISRTFFQEVVGQNLDQ